VIWGKKI